jgi:hypothetical protein
MFARRVSCRPAAPAATSTMTKVQSSTHPKDGAPPKIVIHGAIMRSLIFALAVFATLPAVAFAGGLAPHPPAPGGSVAPPPTGTISVCNASGARPVTGSFTYTIAAPAGAGGSQIFNIAVGSCSAAVFYPVGTVLIVTENVPSGSAVTSLVVSGGASTLASSSLSAGSGTVTVGTGASTATFTTSGPPGTFTPPSCKVPNVIGLTLTAAKAALIKQHCTTGVVRRAYSAVFNAGRLASSKPRRGTVMAHNAPVDLTVSRGPKP